jgi:hypothetical protein
MSRVVDEIIETGGFISVVKLEIELDIIGCWNSKSFDHAYNLVGPV